MLKYFCRKLINSPGYYYLSIHMYSGNMKFAGKFRRGEVFQCIADTTELKTGNKFELEGPIY